MTSSPNTERANADDRAVRIGDRFLTTLILIAAPILSFALGFLGDRLLYLVRSNIIGVNGGPFSLPAIWLCKNFGGNQGEFFNLCVVFFLAVWTSWSFVWALFPDRLYPLFYRIVTGVALVFLLVCACISFSLSVEYYYALQKLDYTEGIVSKFTGSARLALLIISVLFLAWGVIRRYKRRTC